MLALESRGAEPLPKQAQSSRWTGFSPTLAARPANSANSLDEVADGVMRLERMAQSSAKIHPV